MVTVVTVTVVIIRKERRTYCVSRPNTNLSGSIVKRIKKIKEDYLENSHKVCTFVGQNENEYYVRETFWI